MPGHWEGDLIKGKANASSVGTMVGRTSGYLMLVKMNDATAGRGIALRRRQQLAENGRPAERLLMPITA
jgi:IS30 family transposase